MTPDLDTAPCLFFSSTDSGEIVFVNQTLCTTLGFTRDDLIHQNIEKLFPISSRIFFQTHVFPSLQINGKVDEMFMFLRSSTGEQISTLVNGSKSVGRPNINTFVAIRVENRQKFEEELIESKKRAEKLLLENELFTDSQERLRIKTRELDKALFNVKSSHDELTQLNKVVTHDLQEPLRKLLFVMDMMKNPMAEADRTQEMLDRLGRATRQLRSVVKMMQEYIWIIEQPVKWQAVDLNKLIREQAEKAVSTHTQPNSPQFDITNIPGCSGDEKLLKTVFHHLFDNALRYSEPERSNTVTVRGAVVKRNTFRHTEEHYEYKQYVRIEITDRGAGFPAGELLNPFRLFKKMHQQDGLGMGLALSRRIVEKHDGFIEIESTIGKGTRVELFLPADWKDDSPI